MTIEPLSWKKDVAFAVGAASFTKVPDFTSFKLPFYSEVDRAPDLSQSSLARYPWLTERANAPPNSAS